MTCQDLLRFDQLPRRLGISPAAAEKRRSRDRFPVPLIRIGGRWFARRRDIEDWEARGGWEQELDRKNG